MPRYAPAKHKGILPLGRTNATTKRDPLFVPRSAPGKHKRFQPQSEFKISLRRASALAGISKLAGPFVPRSAPAKHKNACPWRSAGCAHRACRNRYSLLKAPAQTACAWFRAPHKCKLLHFTGFVHSRFHYPDGLAHFNALPPQARGSPIKCTQLLSSCPAVYLSPWHRLRKKLKLIRFLDRVARSIQYSDCTSLTRTCICIVIGYAGCSRGSASKSCPSGAGPARTAGPTAGPPLGRVLAEGIGSCSG